MWPSWTTAFCGSAASADTFRTRAPAGPRFRPRASQAAGHPRPAAGDAVRQRASLIVANLNGRTERDLLDLGAESVDEMPISLEDALIAHVGRQGDKSFFLNAIGRPAMKSLIWKEWREHLKWVPLPGLAILLVFLIDKPEEPMPWSTGAYFFCLIAVGFGAALGFLQVFFESQATSVRCSCTGR